MKHTKRMLLLSALSMLLCVAMLAATTFAWFTDTASASVNAIKSGTLDVEIQDADNQKITQLNWVKADGTTIKNQDAILWEPGCTYLLTPFKIVNRGTLAMKCRIAVTGIKTAGTADAAVDLNDQIDWTFGTLNINDSFVLLPGRATELQQIRGTMKTSAGNEYQGLSIKNISFTVLATQAASESDSFSNQYDASADMTPNNLDQMVTANIVKPAAAGESTVLAGDGVTATVPANAVADGTQLNLKVTPQASNVANIAVQSDEAYQAYEIDLLANGAKAAPAEPVSVELFVGKNLSNVKLYHNADALESTYSSETGMVSFSTSSFSPFTVVYDAPAARIGQVYYSSLSAAVAGAKDGDTICMYQDAPLTANLTVNNSVTIVGNGSAVISGCPVYVSANANVTFSKVNFALPDNAKHNASSIYASSYAGKLTFDGCTFTNPQWECIQVTPLDGAEIVVTNCRLILDGKAVYAQAGGQKAERLLHIQNTKATGAYKVTVTDNAFIGVDKVRNAVIDIDDIAAFGNVICGGNTFANHDGSAVTTLDDGLIYINLNGKYDAASVATGTFAQFTQNPAAELHH